MMNSRSLAFLKKLVGSIGPSGYEDEAAQVWEKEAKTFADEVRRDSHGNTIALVNKGGNPRIMIAGHTDEIGFIITHVDDEGFLWIGPVGGWDPQIVLGQRVTIRGKKGHVPGVIGNCPIHLMSPESRKKIVEISDMWVDIGAKSRREALRFISIGDPLVLADQLELLPGDLAVARGLDNRAGAFVVLEAARMLNTLKPTAEIYAVATVQEEIGLRGAKTAAYGIDPHVGIAIDVTFATDQPGLGNAVRREGRIKLGSGPVMTRGPNINAKLFTLLESTAKSKKIPYQVNAEPGATGTDANALQLSRAGVATALVSIPNRYMHSPCEMVSLKDLDASAKLLAHTCVRITGRTRFIPF